MLDQISTLLTGATARAEGFVQNHFYHSTMQFQKEML